LKSQSKREFFLFEKRRHRGKNVKGVEEGGLHPKPGGGKIREGKAWREEKDAVNHLLGTMVVGHSWLTQN